MRRVEELFYGRKRVRAREEHEPYLRVVEEAAAALDASRTGLTAAVRAARDADVPFRAIAAAAGVSHEQIRRIVDRGAYGRARAKRHR